MMMASTGHATAHGSGRTAPDTTGNLTTALTLAVGGTALMRMMTGLMTGGSPATNSPHGTPAGGEQSRFYDDSSLSLISSLRRQRCASSSSSCKRQRGSGHRPEVP